MWLAAASLLIAQFGFSDDTLDPRTYVSPSGELELHIDPSEKNGAGPGRYALTRNGEKRWEKVLPVTLAEAEVTDAGFAVGYAYSHGPTGLGKLHVVILSPDGEPLLDELRERRTSRMIHGAPVPRARGILVGEGGERFVVRVDVEEEEDRGQAWWSYDVASGEPREVFYPAYDMAKPFQGFLALSEARALRGEELFLLHWIALGASTFTLVDFDGTIVWVKTHARGDESFDRVIEQGAILSVDPDGRFGLWFVGAGKRIDFQAVSAADSEDGWRVQETSRSDFAPPEQPTVELPELQLAKLGTVELARAETPSSPIRDFRSWSPTADGGFWLVRQEGDDRRRFTLVRVDAGGKSVGETPFDALEEEPEGSIHWTHLGEEAWLLTISPWGGKRPTAYRADALTGALRRLDAFRCPSVDEVVATGDGGFAVLASSTSAAASYMVDLFDAEGRRGWRIGADYEDPTKLFSPEDLALTTDGLLVVLDVVADRVQVFRTDGSHVKNIELEEAWGKEPNYPSGITASPDGGVLIHDFNGDPPLWEMDLEGVVRRTLDPARADGHRDDSLSRAARFAPDGTLWTTDGYTFQRLDEDGVVDLEVGERQGAEAFEVPGPAAIDRFGRICVQDRRSGKIHVWDATGRRLFLAEPDPNDFEPKSSLARIAAGPDGEFLVQADSTEPFYVHFDAEGKRVARLEMPADDLVFGLRADQVWVWDFRGGIRLVDMAGTVQVEVERLPDRRWIRGVAGAGIDADGSLVLLDRSAQMFDTSFGSSLAVYEPDGRPRKLVRLGISAGDGAVAVAEDWILHSSYMATALLIRRADDAVFLFRAAPEGDESTWTMGLSPDGSELWALRDQDLVLHRYALP